LLRLMVVTAHPDDEAGSFGGTLLLSRQLGVKTAVICLTPGQAGSHKGGAKTPAELAAMRREEFARAARLLDVDLAEVLDFPDGGLDRADFGQMTAGVVHRMRSFKPHVVITFGGEGGLTAHPDHSMAGLAGSAAFHWAGRSNRFRDQFEQGLTPWRAQKLYYSASDFTIPGREPIAHAPITLRIDVSTVLDQKIAAFKAHTSQAPLFDRFSEMVRGRGNYESFHLVATREPRVAGEEKSLFEGIVGD
jgi:LmbE family N-acetylglucosaminyl deacetylase